MDSKAHDILTSLPLFQGVGALDIVRILDNVNCELQRLDAGQRWQQQGDVCQQLVFMVSGSMKVTTSYAEGTYTFTEIVESPKVIEPDILFGIQRQYTASYTAECSCQLLTIPKNDISRMLFSIEVFRLNFLNLLSTLSVRNRNAVLPQPVSNTATRFAHFIQAHTASPKGWKLLNIRQEDLCKYLGISRMVLSNTLHDLEHKGLIRIGRNTIEVPEMEHLVPEPKNMTQAENPFLNKTYGTPFDTVPFGKIKFEDYEPAMLEGMKRDDADIERILSNPDAPTFENTIIPKGDHTLSRVSNVFFNLISANTNDQFDALAQKMSPILTEHSNKIMLNAQLWERVKAVYENHRPLSPEENTLLENMYQSFVRHGALLSDEDKERFAKLQMELSQVTLQFQQNMLKDTNAFQLHITDKEELKGLPDSQMEAAALAAKQKGLEGWLFTLHAPSYGPFMTYAENAELRKKMYMAHMTLCTHDNENNNIPLVPRIVNLRRQLANILGYPTFADFILERRMAKDIPHVQALLHDLLEAYMPTARKELEEVTALARETEGEDYEMQPWDFSYYSHKLRMQRYNIDSEILRPYFELSKVKEGVFGLATRLYGITFHKHTDIDVYHPDVEAWEVRDKDDTYLGILYTDFHPRESKQSGAWMTTYKEQWIDEEDGRDSRPHASVTMNFTKPTETKPALLTLGEVETFLHEFGHSLHALFSQVRFESLSCTNVYWDFVELPSQFMENYATEPEFLNTFARHYETGEPLPQELIDRIIRSKNFMAAYACIRQVSLGMLDMAYYTLTDDFDADVMAFEQEAWKACRLLPQIPGTCMTTQFGHIMSGGYAAGYYSYKWAEVLDADAFSVFQEHGIFDRETATRFRNEILSRGGTEAPMTLYKRFRGGEPTIDALLRRNGIQLTVERANSRQEAKGKSL